MTLTMLDDIFVANLPPGAGAYLGYVGGWWPTYDELVARFPGVPVLSTAINLSEDAECLDVENGDATIADIYDWFTRQQARGVWRPVIYHSAYQMNNVVATMTANGFARAEYRLLCAHYEGWEHICGPGTCGLVDTDCDGTQWTDTAPGLNGSQIDASVLADDFFAPVPQPQPGPAPAPAGKKADPMMLTNGTGAITAETFGGGTYTSIGFGADTGLAGGGDVLLRVAAFSNHKGWSQVAQGTSALKISGTTGGRVIFTFTEPDVSVISVQRVSGTAADDTPVGYDLA